MMYIIFITGTINISIEIESVYLDVLILRIAVFVILDLETIILFILVYISDAYNSCTYNYQRALIIILCCAQNIIFQYIVYVTIY